ncbi:CoA-binding protein [Maribacter sp. 4U21]|uniref:CoA-binding protein n=1 Tax=Maribacter sp. 4U21 TaxID=1889779 RepID=UPI000C154453|nr:CoA-binding protein [Maribacter sp. 4U21]PIB27026.1 CoA-binding protein [Maribacter sp. 4U21]
MKQTLVFGASLKSERYSNIAVKRLVNKGIQTEAFGLRRGNIGGIEVNTNLDKFQDIHTITLYLNPQRQKQYYKDILALHPKRVIFNPGTENPEFYKLLKESNIEVEVACTLVLLATGQY